jgi:hypothetical protein
MRLKVAQCQHAAADAPVSISQVRGDLRLSRPVLFELLVQVAEYAPSQLAKGLSKDQLCELLRACSESDGQAKPFYASSLKKHEIAENLQSALIALASSGSANFRRVESLQMECFTLFNK